MSHLDKLRVYCKTKKQKKQKNKKMIYILFLIILHITMEVIAASICLFVMTGGITGVAIYEHDKIIRYIKVAEKKQLIIEKIRKDLSRGK